MAAQLPVTSGDRVEVRGQPWSVLDTTTYPDCVVLTLAGAGETNAGVRRTVLAPFDRVRPAAGPARLHVVRPRRWLHAVTRAACGARPWGGLTAALGSSADLLGYQLEPVLACLRDGATRVLIADGVGLGKTIEAGLLLAELARGDEGMRALVLAPAGLRAQWSRELALHFHINTVRADSAWLLGCARELPPDVNPWLLPGIYVASYDFVKRPEVLRALEDLTWDAVIVDEAHNATRGSARRCAIGAVAARARRVVLLTATPHSGSAGDFEALCGIGTRDPRHDPIVLFRRLERVAQRPRRSVRLGVRPTPSERRMHRLLEKYSREVCREAAGRGDLQARLAVLVLRKRALSSAWSLAISARRRLELLAGRHSAAGEQLPLPLADEDPLDDDLADAALAAPGLADEARERRLLEQVVTAADEAARAESKVARLRRLLSRMREPVIVFTEYRDTLARLRRALAAGAAPDRAILLLHGGQSPAEREAVQQCFARDGGVLLATDAAAEGLNLHARCRVVVHFELPWSPGRLEQRAGRVDRIGQRRRVHEVALVANDTAERVVLLPLLGRLARIQRDLPGTMASPWSDAQLAAALLEGTVADVAVEPPVAPELYVAADPAVADAAIDEVRRLTVMRDWRPSQPRSTRVRHRHAVPVTIVRGLHPGLLPGAMVVYEVRLASSSGRIIHSQLAVVHVEGVAVDGDGGAARARECAGRVLRDSGELAVRRLEEALGPCLDGIADSHARSADRLIRREASLVEAAASASRELVQAGLFDARATRDRAQRVEADAHVAEDSARRMDALACSSFRKTFEVRAVLLVGGGRARR